MQVGDLVKRTGYGAYQKIYDEETHMGIVMDNLSGHQLCEVFWFKESKKILTNRHVVEVISSCK